jgi:hypothetical protein
LPFLEKKQGFSEKFLRGEFSYLGTFLVQISHDTKT